MTLEVGQKVYLKPVGNNLRRGVKEIQEYEIRKVGRKYLEVWQNQDERWIEKFHLDGFRQVSEYAPIWVLYFNMQEILDEEEAERLTREIRNIFDGYGKPKLSLDQLREIARVINGIK